MPPELGAPRRFDFPITLALTLIGVVLSAGLIGDHDQAQRFIADRAAIADGELWRLFTGALVHIDLGQAGRDLSVFFLLGAVHEGLFGWRWAPLMLLLLPLGPALAFAEGAPSYFGLSCAVNGLFALSLIEQWRRARAPWIALLAAVFLGKLLYEGFSGDMMMPMALERGVRPLPLAHLGGALVGGLCALIVRSSKAA